MTTESPVEIPVPPPLAASRHSSRASTIPLLCAGLALVACCLIVPQVDQNRRLAWQRQRLQIDLEQIQKQLAVNSDFIHRLADDPALGQRLAQRQLRIVPEGADVLDLGAADAKQDMSPYRLAAVPVPQLRPYQPLDGLLNTFCGNRHLRLWTMGIGIFLLGAALVHEAPGRREAEDPVGALVVNSAEPLAASPAEPLAASPAEPLAVSPAEPLAVSPIEPLAVSAVEPTEA